MLLQGSFFSTRGGEKERGTGDAKDFFVKKSSALSKNFEKGMGINSGLSVVRYWCIVGTGVLDGPKISAHEPNLQIRVCRNVAANP